MQIRRRQDRNPLALDDGSQVVVVGGGPAGSFFAYFLLTFAERAHIDLAVDIYEPRDFSSPAPAGCNMCGGIISESLVQMLAAEGIELPADVVQRGIDSYVLHMDVGTVRIDTPLHEMRIGAVHRGGGPRDLKTPKWGSFDGYLLSLAVARGARVHRVKVERVLRQNGRPVIKLRNGEDRDCDLVVICAGVNSGAGLCAHLDTGYRAPRTGKAYIREFYLGVEGVAAALGSSMHVFLPETPKIEFAAIVPKGDYATLCMLGDDLDKETVQRFLGAPWVRCCMPEAAAEGASCQCSPRLSLAGARLPFADRVVFVGDCGVTRLYKDGIGAAYRTAKAAAGTAIFAGVSADAFRRHFWPACRRIERDNFLGRIVFRVTKALQRTLVGRRAILDMTRREQARDESQRRMSKVLWNVFTGSEPYREILLRTLHPLFIARLAGHLAAATRRPAASAFEEKT
jgi:flavin-dependent dehydrogenase